MVDLLSREGHTVEAPDLPGHGRDTTPPARISLDQYSKFISRLIDEYDEKVILVGHSMAGMVISRAAELKPGKISRLVYVAGFLPGNGDSVFGLMAANKVPGETEPTLIEQHLRMSGDKRSCDIPREAVPGLFYNHCAPAVAGTALAHFAPQPTLPLSGRIKLSGERFGTVPKVYISCLADRVIPVSHQRRMVSRQACRELLQLDSDHSPFLSHPEELAAILSAL